MKRRIPLKKRVDEIDPGLLSEPPMTAEDWKDFHKGIDLYNSGKFWHAHEAWEDVWKRKHEESRIFFQGLIQMTAAYHQLRNNKFLGMMRHYDNALSKLRLFKPEFLGVDVKHLCDKLEESKIRADELGKERMGEFENAFIPKIRKMKPKT